MAKELKNIYFWKSLNESALRFFGLGLGLMGSIFLIRLVIDTGFRMLYPFIPQVSKGLGLSIAGFGWLLSVRSASGLLGPLLGVLADRYGRRPLMIGALLSQSLGMIWICVVEGWGTIVPMLLLGLATNSFLPAQQAFISDKVSYDRRGRALVSVDIAYSVSGIVLLPVVGWIIATHGWRMPFIILSIFSFISALIIWMFFPQTETKSLERKAESFSWRLILFESNVLSSIFVAILFFITVAIYMSFWGIWLHGEFNYDSQDIGLLATVIGVTELTGAFSSGLIIDKVGKRRTSLLGLSLGAIVFLLVPYISVNELGIIFSLGLLGFSIEFTIVSLFPLYGEQAPDARATVFSMVALGNAIGLAIGVPLMTMLWNYRGIHAITFSSFLFILLAGIVVWKMLDD